MTEEEILARMQERVEGYRRQSPTPGPGPVNTNSDDLYGVASRVQTASNAIGTLNPRNRGFLNDLAQSVKKLFQRSLSWYTRSLRSFGAAVSTAFRRHGEAISQLAYSVEENRRAVDELSRQAQEDLRELQRRVELNLDSVETRARKAESAALRNHEELAKLQSHFERELARVRADVQSKTAKPSEDK